MSIIEKLSDRGGFIYEVIMVTLKNNPPMNKAKLQYELLKCGVYIKAPLLEAAINTLIEKKLLPPPNEKKEANPQEETGKASAPIVQLEPR